MPRVFISYRRSDSSTVSGRIYDHLARTFNDANVFKDVYDIPAGSDFRKVIEDNINACNAQLVVIGPAWLDVRGADGKRRLDDVDDAVRIEVETGLNCKDILLIPVLVSGATMPPPEALPEAIRDLSYHNAVVIRDDPDFRGDIGSLIRTLKQRDARESSRRWRRRAPYLGGLVVVGLILALVGAYLIVNNQGTHVDLVVSDLTGTHVLVLVPTARGQIEATLPPLTPAAPTVAATLPISATTVQVTAEATNLAAVTDDVAGAIDLIQQGDTLQDQGKYADALDHYTKATTLDPNNAQGFLGRGRAYHDLGDTHDALADLTQALKLDPGNADAYRERGWANYDGNMFSAAIADFSAAIEHDPKSSSSYQGRGEAYRDSGDLDHALLDLTQAISIDPDSAELYYERGYTYQLNGEEGSASNDYNEALKRDPNYTNAYVGLARLNLESYNETDLALQYALRAVQLDDTNPYAQAVLGDVYYAQGKKPDALIHYRRYAELMGNKADLSYLTRIHELESS